MKSTKKQDLISTIITRRSKIIHGTTAIAATSNRTEDSTQVIAMTSIYRFHDITTLIEAAAIQLGWERGRNVTINEIDHKELPGRRMP